MIKKAFQWCYKAPFALMRKHWVLTTLFVLGSIALLATGYQVKLTKAHKADLKIIYQKSAQVRVPDRNPVIVIPGVLGSKLIDQETNQTVWGAFDLDYADPNTDEGFQQIALPIGRTTEPSTLTDRVVPIGVLDKMVINILGIPLNIQAYAGILSTLGVGGYRDEDFGKRKAIDYGDGHYTCFQFAYDWRRSNAENAVRFHEFLKQKREQIQLAYELEYGIKDAEVKFDVVAHSMGGLMTRYYLRYGPNDINSDFETPPLTWEGAEYIDRAILVGTPNAGAAGAFVQLINGMDIGRPILPHYPPELVGTFPSAYELLPRPRHGGVAWDDDPADTVENLYDPDLWRENEWGLARRDEVNEELIALLLPDVGSAAERREIALEYQATLLKRAKAFHEAMDSPAKLPEGLELFLVAGDANKKTRKTISIERYNAEIEVLEYGTGDGVVLRSSALLDERVGGEWAPYVKTPIDWSSVMFLFGEHTKITQDPAFTDNVLYWLMEDPRGRNQYPGSQ